MPGAEGERFGVILARPVGALLRQCLRHSVNDSTGLSGSVHSLVSPAAFGSAPGGADDSYLVDSASSHMLVSKIKPCMSKYKHLYRETANGSLNQLSFI
jgi:hypothetical protein